MMWDALRGQGTLSMNMKGCYIGFFFFFFFFSYIQPPTVDLGVGQSISNEPRLNVPWVSNVLACFAELFQKGVCLVRAPSLLGCCHHAGIF